MLCCQPSAYLERRGLQYAYWAFQSAEALLSDHTAQYRFIVEVKTGVDSKELRENIQLSWLMSSSRAEKVYSHQLHACAGGRMA